MTRPLRAGWPIAAAAASRRPLVLRLRHSIWVPVATRKTEPAILTTVYAVAEAAGTAARPSTVNTPQTVSPATTPTAPAQ
jgi:hypothetical protein